LKLVGGWLAMVPGAQRDEGEKERDLSPLMPVFVRFGDFQQVRNCRVSRAVA